VVISSGLPAIEARRGNPFFCNRKEWVDSIQATFSKSYAAIHDGVPDFVAPASPSSDTGARLYALAKETYEFQQQRLSSWKPAAIAPQQSVPTSATQQPSATPSPAKVPIATTSSVTASSGLLPPPDPLQPKAGLYTDTATSLKALAPLEEQARWGKATAASREAKARVTWTGAIGLQIVMTVVAIAGALWIIGTSVEEQSAIPSPGVAAPKNWLICLSIFAGAGAVGAIFVYGIFQFLYELVISRYLIPPSIWPIIPPFKDNISKYISEFLMPGADRLIWFANLLLSIGGVALLVGVSSTLLQRPDDKANRIDAPPDAGSSDPYQEFLTRCFERLRVAIYLGVVCVAQVSSWYAWPVSLIPMAADTEPLGQLNKVINELAGQLGLEYGLAFTVVLIAIYVPAMVILRRRAWQLARSRNPGSSLDIQKDWLVKRNLAFSMPQAMLQSLALLSPAVVGTVLHFFDFLSPK
jgi:hypothetical protein